MRYSLRLTGPGDRRYRGKTAATTAWHESVRFRSAPGGQRSGARQARARPGGAPAPEAHCVAVAGGAVPPIAGLAYAQALTTAPAHSVHALLHSAYSMGPAPAASSPTGSSWQCDYSATTGTGGGTPPCSKRPRHRTKSQPCCAECPYTICTIAEYGICLLCRLSGNGQMADGNHPGRTGAAGEGRGSETGRPRVLAGSGAEGGDTTHCIDIPHAALTPVLGRSSRGQGQ